MTVEGWNDGEIMTMPLCWKGAVEMEMEMEFFNETFPKDLVWISTTMPFSPPPPPSLFPQRAKEINQSKQSFHHPNQPSNLHNHFILKNNVYLPTSNSN